MTVTWMEICLDVTEAPPDEIAAMGRFWSHVTGLRLETYGDPADPGNLVGPPDGGGIALCPVPEPKTVKNRVHLDVYTERIATLVGLGARVTEEHERWTVLTDPQGNEFCGFVRDVVPDYRVYELSVDCVDEVASAAWWGERFGVEPERGGEDWWWLRDVPGMPFVAMVFSAVPEPKTVKNRMHWDVHGDVAELEAAGAHVLWTMPRWTVMADPEGNEFCVFP